MTDSTAISKVKGKPRGGSFAKGVSGNLVGRPKRTPEEINLIAACKAKCPEALGVIVNIMHNGDNERNKLAAATAIIERAYGKPTQPLAGDADNPLQMSLSVVFGKGA